MNIVVVYAHPNEESLTNALFQAFIRGSKRAKHRLHVIDLYKEKFDPVLKKQELKRGHMSDTVAHYHEMLRRADWIVFFYPIWWLGAPSILEGWFDRVFTSGFAFRYKKITRNFGIPIGLLPVKKAMVVDTYGAPWWAAKFFLFDMPWQRIKRGILKYCGVKKIIHYPCYSAPYASVKKRKRWIADIERIAENLK